MDSLVGYGSDDDNEYDNKYDNNSGANANYPSGQILRRDDDTNYDDVTMDMSEESDASSVNAGSGSPQGVTRRSRSASSDDTGRRENVRGSDGGKRNRDVGRGISKRNDRADDYKNKERSNRDKKRRSRSRSSSRKNERERNKRGSRERRGRDRHGDEKSSRRDRSDRDRHERRRESPVSSGKRGLAGDRLSVGRRSESARRDSRSSEPESPKKVPALMDLKPFGGDPPPTAVSLARDQARRNSGQRYDERPARERQSSPRQSSRERDRDRDRRRERDRDGKRGHEKSSSRRSHGRKRSSSRSRRSSRDRRRRTRSRGRHSSDSNEGKSGSSGSMRSGSHDRTRHHPAPVTAGAQSPTNPTDYRPSYKVSKKLQVMEKMGLQIKTPDGSMATAQMLMARTLAEQAAPPGPAGAGAAQLPSYYNPGAVNAAKIVHQVQKRKLLWGRGKPEGNDAAVAPAPAPAAAKWQGTMFAQDTDGKVASKFMRLMGIKDPAVVQPAAPSDGAEVIRKQEELFSAMQAQYDVARATTHTMRGVGLGFQGASTFPRQF